MEEKDDQIFRRIHKIFEGKDDQILEGGMMGFLKGERMGFLKWDGPYFGEERTPILIRIKVQLHHWEDDHQPVAPFLIHFQRALKRGKEN